MILTIASPGQTHVRDEAVSALRAEDASGSFGVHPGFADFLTALEVGVLSWRNPDGKEHHCALRRGVLRVRGGQYIEVASREAIVDDDLERLEATVLAAFRQREDSERSSRTETQRLELQVVRELTRFLRPPQARQRDGAP